MSPMPGRKPPAPSSRHTGSQHALRRRNTDLVIETLTRRGPTTQANLARLTGLSTGTISNIVRSLDDHDLISSRPVIDSGHRAIEISLRGDQRLAIGVDVERSQLRVILARLDHTVVAEVVEPLCPGHAPEPTLARVGQIVREVLEANAVPDSEVVGAGLAVPTALDHDRRAARPDTLLPHWHDTDLCSLASEMLPCPTHIENDANLGALAHLAWGPYDHVNDLVFIQLDEGIGAGIIVGGKLVRGHAGLAGELGHLPVPGLDEWCHCGNRGCLHTVASTGQIRASLRRARRGRDVDEAGIVELARARDVATMRILEDAGFALGTTIASVCNLLNPEVVVIGGPLVGVGAPLLDPVTRGIGRRALPAVAAGTRLAMSHLGARAVALGGISLAARCAMIPRT